MAGVVVVINRDQMGAGDVDLGQRILQAFFAKAVTGLPGLNAMLFYNAGVKLLVEGSPCLQALAALESGGIDLIACGTCIDHYRLVDQLRVGEVGSMDGILQAMAHADKVITL
jgi:selenium metabolism protein YedF